MWKPNDYLLEYLKDGIKSTNIDLIIPKNIENKTIEDLIKDVEVVIGWRPWEELFKKANKLKVMINPGAGVQHLLPEFYSNFKEKGITLINGHGNSYFTAQHAVAMLFTLLNKILLHHNWMVEGQWRKSDQDAKSIPLRQKRIGLFGYGAINQKVHRFLSGFSVTFGIYKLHSDTKIIQDLLLNITDFTEKIPQIYSENQYQEFLQDTDILIIAVPLTNKTSGIIAMKELELLGKDAIIINVGRGKIIDEESLYNALSQGKIAGAGIDVWYDYQPEEVDGKKYPYNSSKYKFHELDNIVLSPHRGASPMDDLERWDEVVENLIRIYANRTDLLNIVDIEEGY
jgi:phosphoglycerate dehydrogenase-like enzyme